MATHANGTRATRATALGVSLGGFTTLVAAGNLLGDTPAPHDSPEKIAAYFTEHDVRIALAVSLLGLVTIFFQIGASELAPRRRGRLDTLRHGLATTFTTLLLTGLVLPLAALAYSVAEADAELAHELFVLTLITSNVAAWPLAMFLGLTGVVHWRARRTLAISLLALAAITVPGTVSFAYSGPFSPDVQQQVTLFVLTWWFLITGLTHWKQHPAEKPGAATPTPVTVMARHHEMGLTGATPLRSRDVLVRRSRAGLAAPAGDVERAVTALGMRSQARP
jgi:hypothetical protein